MRESAREIYQTNVQDVAWGEVREREDPLGASPDARPRVLPAFVNDPISPNPNAQSLPLLLLLLPMPPPSPSQAQDAIQHGQ